MMVLNFEYINGREKRASSGLKEDVLCSVLYIAVKNALTQMSITGDSAVIQEGT